MKLVFPKSAPGRFLTALGLAALVSANAQQPSPEPGAVLRFTEPTAPVTSTNLAEPSLRKFILGDLDRNTRKPFEFFNSEDSFSGVLAPPPQRLVPPALNSRRAKELLDRQKNWVFNTPDEMYGLPSAAEMMNVREYGPDGKEKTPKNSFERYFERMEKAGDQTATNQVANDSLANWLKPGDGEEQPTLGNDGQPTGYSIFGNPETNAKRPPGFGEFSSPFSSGPGTATERSFPSFSAFRSPDSGNKPLEKNPAQEARMQAFQQLLDSGAAGSPGFGAGFGSSSLAPAEVASPPPAISVGALGFGSFSPQSAARPATLPSLSPVPAPTGFTKPVVSPPPVANAPWTFTPRPPAFELPKPKY